MATKLTGPIRFGPRPSGGGAPGTWAISRPNSTRKGAALVVKRNAIFSENVVLVEKNNRREPYRPPAECAQYPELSSLSKNALIVPVLDITSGTPRSYLYPFVESNWSGYQRVVDALDSIPADGIKLLWLQHHAGVSDGNSIGDYSIRLMDVPPQYLPIVEQIKWAEQADVEAAMPPLTFSQLIEADFSLRLLWEDLQKSQKESVA